MQAGFDPDSPDSFQFSFDGPPRAVQFGGHFAIRVPVKLEQYDFPHRFIGNRCEQLIATFGDFGQ